MKVETLSTNPHCRIFHVRAAVCDAYEHKEYGSVCGTELSPLPQLLFDCQGVVSILAKPYEVFISKNHAFEWTEIQPTIETILLDFERQMGVGEGCLTTEHTAIQEEHSND